MRSEVPATEFARYRVQIDIDGNSNSWSGLFRKLLTGNPVLKIASSHNFRQWYYDRLVPWQHYVPVESDMRDLVEKVRWALAHEDKARAIGDRGAALASTMTYDAELRHAVDTIGHAIRTATSATPDTGHRGRAAQHYRKGFIKMPKWLLHK